MIPAPRAWSAAMKGRQRPRVGATVPQLRRQEDVLVAVGAQRDRVPGAAAVDRLLDSLGVGRRLGRVGQQALNGGVARAQHGAGRGNARLADVAGVLRARGERDHQNGERQWRGERPPEGGVGRSHGQGCATTRSS
jgi:hypothetical protein